MEGSQKNIPFKDRRSGKDRRERQTSPLSLKSLFGSRKDFRRREDAQKQFLVDLYSPFFLVLLVFTLSLSLADAFLTIRLMEENFQELNPLMDFFIRLGPATFILVKAGLTAVGLTTLLILKNYYFWRKIRTEALLMAFSMMYLILVAYEIIMVMRL